MLFLVSLFGATAAAWRAPPSLKAHRPPRRAGAPATALPPPRPPRRAVAPAAVAPAPRPPLSLEEYEAAAANELGRDPRDAPPWVTSNTELLAELAATSSVPKAALASATDAVAPIGTLEEFEAAVARACATKRVLVTKFYSQGCRACLNIKPLYERLANGPMHEHVDFYEVDVSAAKLLQTYANINSVPVMHVYLDGELYETLPSHGKELFDAFAARLTEIVLSSADFGARYGDLR